MNYVNFLGKRVTRVMILKALDEFDRKYPNTNSYDRWLEKSNYKYELIEKGRRYPPKHILSEASGIPVSRFGGGDQTNGIFTELGFVIRSKIKISSSKK